MTINGVAPIFQAAANSASSSSNKRRKRREISELMQVCLQLTVGETYIFIVSIYSVTFPIRVAHLFVRSLQFSLDYHELYNISDP